MDLMKILFKNFVCYLSLIFIIPYVFAGVGGDHSGGGVGVACFESDEAAIEFDQVGLSGNILRKTLRVLTYDFWEGLSKEEQKKIASKKRGQSYDENEKVMIKEKIVQLTHQNVESASPLFLNRLLEVSEQVPMDQWQRKDFIPMTHDLGGHHEIGGSFDLKTTLLPNCRIVQIARRTMLMTPATSNEVGTLESGFYKPVAQLIKVEVNPDLLSMMDPLNISMLKSHEEIYVIATLLGQYDSKHTRQLVRIIHDKNFIQNFGSVKFQKILVKLGFKNYYKLFIDNVRERQIKMNHYSESSRMLSYISLEEKISKLKTKKGGALDEEKALIFLEKELNDEEAFLLYVNAKINEESEFFNLFGNIEYLMDERRETSQGDGFSSLLSRYQGICMLALSDHVSSSEWFLMRNSYFAHPSWGLSRVAGSVVRNTPTLVGDLGKVTIGNVVKGIRKILKGPNAVESTQRLIKKVNKYCDEIEKLPDFKSSPESETSDFIFDAPKNYLN